MSRTLTTEEFINKANIVHSYRYDYSITKYTASRNKLLITCPKHGVFEQNANSHLRGCGCDVCGRESCTTKVQKSPEKFISQANEKHGGKYDYSDVQYINSKTKVIIKCVVHGPFKQTPDNHLGGCGCPMCGNNIPYTKDVFISKSTKIHNGYYDYSQVVFKNMREKVEIVCPEHGVFKQTPFKHIKGSGCNYCSFKKVGDKLRHSKEYFIERCVITHGDDYDYSLVEYVNSGTPVIIVCKKHGQFSQSPYSHYTGAGCPRCSHSKGETHISKYLTEHGFEFTTQHKFNDCVYKYRLRFDFYIPKYNLCIEFDGIQHFEPVELFGGVDAFIETKHRDDIKTKYCLDNNINLLRIRFDDDIDMKLQVYFHNINRTFTIN